MSWGYFADLDISLPTDLWKKLREQHPGDFRLAPGWSGLEDRDLEKRFARAFSEDETFAKILKGKAFHAEASGSGREPRSVGGSGRSPHREAFVHHVEELERMTSVRIVLMLDKSTLELVYPLATLLMAARETGVANGTLRLVNDGSAPGEAGVEITLAKNKLTTAKVDDPYVLVEELMEELYGDLVSGPLKAKSSKAFPVSSKRKN